MQPTIAGAVLRSGSLRGSARSRRAQVSPKAPCAGTVDQTGARPAQEPQPVGVALRSPTDPVTDRDGVSKTPRDRPLVTGRPGVGRLFAYASFLDRWEFQRVAADGNQILLQVCQQAVKHKLLTRCIHLPQFGHCLNLARAVLRYGVADMGRKLWGEKRGGPVLDALRVDDSDVAPTARGRFVATVLRDGVAAQGLRHLTADAARTLVGQLWDGGMRDPEDAAYWCYDNAPQLDGGRYVLAQQIPARGVAAGFLSAYRAAAAAHGLAQDPDAILRSLTEDVELCAESWATEARRPTTYSNARRRGDCAVPGFARVCAKALLTMITKGKQNAEP